MRTLSEGSILWLEHIGPIVVPIQGEAYKVFHFYFDGSA